jgi:hypothetical protein
MHLDGLWLALAVKMVATSILVVGALAAAERAGPFWGALIVALPVSVGPTYLILAIDHDEQFIARSALASLAGNAAIGLFLLAYARIGSRLGAVFSLIGSIAVWAAASLLVTRISWTAATAALANLVVFGGGAWATRRLAKSGSPLGRRAKRWYEAPMRALLVGLLVASVTSISYAIGPRATGILAMFPIVSVSLAGILHGRFGGKAVVPIMASTIRTVPSLALGLLVIMLTVEPWGKLPSLSAALVATLAWPMGLVAFRLRGQSRPARAVTTT